jgi:hypothetical protein
MTAYLYRAYDANGALLYVGQSNNPMQRRAQHLASSGSDWASEAREWRITGPYPDGQILELEAIAIRDENPRCNVRCAVLPPTHRGNRGGVDHDPLAIRRALRRSTLTQKDLAAAIGKGQSLVSEILKGTRNATPATIQRIAEVLGCEVESLEVAS